MAGHHHHFSPENLSETFTFTGIAKKLSFILMGIGVLGLVLGFIVYGFDANRVWANLLLNGYYFNGIALAAVFFLATHQIGYGGWHTILKRIPESMSTFLPVSGGVLILIMIGAALHFHHVYHWSDSFITEEKVTVAELVKYEQKLAEMHPVQHEEEHGDAHGGGHNEAHGTQGGNEGHADTHQPDKLHNEETSHTHEASKDDTHAVNSHSEDVKSVSDMAHSEFLATAIVDSHSTAHTEEDHSASIPAEVRTADVSTTDHSSDQAGHGDASNEEHGGGDHHIEYFAANYAGVDPSTSIDNPHYDKIIDGKRGFLNMPFFSLRVLLYVLAWSLLAMFLRKLSIQEDTLGGIINYNKGKYLSAFFIVVFAVTSSTAAWDFVMSIDTHWYSTLFGWYNFASYLVASVSTIALILIYLRLNGYLKVANDSHLHDLGKLMFGFSIFWTYLFFAQFLLIWYGNIPEATAYFQARFSVPGFKFLFYLLFILNFALPFLVLMKRRSKRDMETVGFVAIIILIGHWLDYYLMIMPGGVGAPNVGLGWLELSLLAGFVGVFIYVTLSSLTKASLIPQKNPHLKESLQHHI